MTNPLLSPRRMEAVVQRLAENKPVRRSFPAWGRLHIDRQLPFLCLYRKPCDREDPSTEKFCVVEAAYLLAQGDPDHHASLQDVVRAVAQVMVERFGAFLILEVWSSPLVEDLPRHAPPRTGFVVHRPVGNEISKTVDALHERLRRVRTSKLAAEVQVKTVRRVAPPGLRPLFSPVQTEGLGVHVLGLEIKPIYVRGTAGETFPLLVRSLRRQLGQVLDRTFYEYARECTTHQPMHYHALGRRAVVKAVWDVDRRLAAVSNSFDLLFQVTPVNARRAWLAFQRKHFEEKPSFLYRPRAIDPGRMKRALYDIPIERVEDPTLMNLFLAKQVELDRQLSLLNDLGERTFLYGSLQLHGEVSPSLLRTARQILSRTPPRSRSDSRGGFLTAARFAARARTEIAWYQRHTDNFPAKARVADDIYAGLLVSRGRLLIGKDARISVHRAEALLQHEVGVHLLTYFNGQAQPLKMLSSGLPGYDELQEGLAVLSEYLVGGLSTSRLRVLAARVLAAHALIDGATFVDVFRLLDDSHGFTQRVAYTITTRVFRGGGLVKDAVYLRGLVGVLNYLSKGGDLNKLFIGKIAAAHVNMMDELLHRRILKPTPVLPRFLALPDSQRRLLEAQEGMEVLDLLRTRRKVTR